MHLGLPEFLVVFLVVGYFVPAVVAGLRHHRHTAAIAALDVLLGWTVIGWIAALVWALMDQRNEPVRARLGSPD